MTNALSRADRKDTIALVFSIALQNGLPNELTSYAIAKRLGLKPSSKLNAILIEMVQEGTLTMKEKVRSDGLWFKRIYSLNPQHYKFPKSSPREIRINGQLNLW